MDDTLGVSFKKTLPNQSYKDFFLYFFSGFLQFEILHLVLTSAAHILKIEILHLDVWSILK